MEGMLSPEIKEEILGTAEVLETYHITKVGTVAGCIVKEGKIKRSSKIRLIRDGYRYLQRRPGLVETLQGRCQRGDYRL